MEFKKMFTRNYKKVCMDITDEQITKRLEGIDAVIEQFDSFEKIAEIVKMYFKMECDSETREEFVNCFYEVDKTFDEENVEEISILAGCVLACFIEDYEDVQLAYSIKVLECFFEGKVPELFDIANEVISRQTREEEELDTCPSVPWQEEWECELVDESGKAMTTAPKATVDLLEIIRNQLSELVDYSNALRAKNERCEEKIEVLSWLVGEWSNLLERPLSEVGDVEGTLVLGVELAKMVNMPGPFAAESFLNKMLSKCKTTVGEISLTELVDSQTETIRQYVSDNYGKVAEKKNLPILSAIKVSLTVDEKKVWLHTYKKMWKINPDEVILSLKEWSKLIYLECMISKY